MDHIDTVTLRRWQTERRDFILLDVLPASVFAAGHIAGAVNLISDDIMADALARFPDRDRAIVVYCGSVDCKRAGLAAGRLEKLGYTNVWHYRGGKREWRAAGLPAIVGGAASG